MSNEYILVTDFHVLPSVLFLCIFCGVANSERRLGKGHMSTGSHCDNCGTWYIVDWDEQNQPTIKMKQVDEVQA
jgi:transcription elongation factor Elf1